MAGVIMRFRIAPRGQPFDGAPVAEVQGNAGPQGVYFSQLDGDRFDDWDPVTRVSGPKGGGVSRIPVRGQFRREQQIVTVPLEVTVD